VNNTIVFAPTPSSGLQQVPTAGGPVENLTTPDRTRGEGGHRWPQFLPDGRSLVFAAGPSTTNTNWSEARIVLLAIDSRRQLDVVSRGTSPHYVGGVLFYVEGSALLGRPLDLSHPERSADSVVVAEQVAQSGGGGAQLSISQTGTLAYAVGIEREPQPLVWVDRSGAEEPLSMAPARYATPRLSPDGHRIAVVVSGENSDIWVYDLDRSTSMRLTSEAGNLAPVWSPDGLRVAFGSNRRGSSDVYWMRADRQGGEEQLTANDGIYLPTSWSRSTGAVLVTSVNAASNVDILMLERPGGSVVPVVRTSFAEERAVFSPAAPYIAYTATETGRSEVYVRGLPPDDRRWLLSAGGGTDPVWSHDGKELFFRSGDDLMAVDITATPQFRAGKPHKLFSGRYASGVVAGYDVNADGSRFLMVRQTRPQDLRELRVAVGWLDEVRLRLGRQLAAGHRLESESTVVSESSPGNASSHQ
jgi:serine/threonine-protein kinase